MGNTRRLSRADWIGAALEAIARGGQAAVAIGPIADRLGASRGSFYWHFSSRRELLVAALQRWEQEETEDYIASVAAVDDPCERLRVLARAAFASTTIAEVNDVELALQASTDDPDVADTLSRVGARRLGHLEETFRLLGHDEQAVGQRALTAYASYLGHAQLVRATPHLVPEPGALADYVERWVALLTSPTERSGEAF